MCQITTETIRDLETLVDSIETLITYNDEATLPNGTAACVCTNSATLICQLAGKGEVWGYRDENNPRTKCGQFAGGHDFAFIDNRFIVDHWI